MPEKHGEVVESGGCLFQFFCRSVDLVDFIGVEAKFIMSRNFPSIIGADRCLADMRGLDV